MNLFDSIPEKLPEELAEVLARGNGVRMERIISRGHSSPEGFWYDQGNWEWVMVVRGAAGVLFEGDAEAVRLGPGDYLTIPPHRKHRVEWTDPGCYTVWLAVHWAE
ncbi:MAG: cupin domain-containing protein [Desulfatiglandaceae bacterium]